MCSGKAGQMAKATPVENLNAKISSILQEYADEVSVNCGNAVKKVGQAGATALRQQSRSTFGGSGRYASGWSSQYTEGRLSSSAVIYNNHPGLPHLLENGHAKRGGGRVSGRAHISVVEEELVNQFQREVENTT